MFGNHGRLAAPNLDTAPMPQSPRLVAKRRHRKWPWILLALVVLFVIVAAIGGSPAPTPASTSAPAPAPAPAPTPEQATTVVYRVTSDASTVSVTYDTTKNGLIQQAQDNTTIPPWSKSLSVDKSWFHSYSLLGQMSPASNGGHDGTTISCSITVGGKVIADNTSTGPYATVTCTG